MATEQSIVSLLIELKAKVDAVPQISAAVNQVVKDANTANAKLSQISENTNGAMTKALRGVTNIGTQLLSTFGIITSVGGAMNFVKDSIEKFAASEATIAKLGASVAVAGGNFDKLRPLIRQTAEELSQFGFSNREVNDAIAAFINRGFSVHDALTGVSSAAKLATLEGIPLAEAIHDITLASQGYIRPGSLLGQLLGNLRAELEKGGDKAENFQKVIEKLGHLDPAVEAQLGTLANRTKTLGTAWDEFKTNLGGQLDRFLGLTGIVSDLGAAMKNYNDETDRANRLANGTASPGERLQATLEARENELRLLLKFTENQSAQKSGKPMPEELGMTESEMGQISGFTGISRDKQLDILIGRGGKDADKRQATENAEFGGEFDIGIVSQTDDFFSLSLVALHFRPEVL